MNSLLRCMGLRMPNATSVLAACRPNVSLRIVRRFMDHDPIRCMIGEREIVGYGINGSPNYIDCPDFPFPAIRYRESTAESAALQEKEQGDWKKLSLEEKKTLYRHSFCQTYAEFQHFTPEWKLCLGIALWFVAAGVIISATCNAFLYDDYPESYNEDNRQAQLRRIIHLQMNPITGLASKWDYSQNKWK